MEEETSIKSSNLVVLHEWNGTYELSEQIFTILVRCIPTLRIKRELLGKLSHNIRIVDVEYYQRRNFLNLECLPDSNRILSIAYRCTNVLEEYARNLGFSGNLKFLSLLDVEPSNNISEITEKLNRNLKYFTVEYTYPWRGENEICKRYHSKPEDVLMLEEIRIEAEKLATYINIYIYDEDLRKVIREQKEEIDNSTKPVAFDVMSEINKDITNKTEKIYETTKSTVVEYWSRHEKERISSK